MRAYQIADRPGLDAVMPSERQEPTPAAEEVVVEVKAVSLNYRDLLVAKGTYANGVKPVGLVPASDGAGRIVAVGDRVSRWKVGDRIAAAFMPGWLNGDLTAEKQASALGGGSVDGMLAERVVLPEHAVVRLPDHLSYEEGATLPCAALTAWYALFEGAVTRPGTEVLLLGTGGVSIFALQFAKIAGARVIITSSSDEKLERARSLGADATINYRLHQEWQTEVLSLTDGIGADHAVEVGGPGTLNRTLAALRFGGSMSLMGVLTGLQDEIDTGTILRKNIRIQGTYVGSIAMFERVMKAISVSKMKPVIDRIFPFEETREAYRYLESGAHFGKVVIKIS